MIFILERILRNFIIFSDLNLWNKSISQRWRKLRRRCSVQESSGPQEALIQSANHGVIHAVRSTPASREASPAAKSLQDGSSSKKLLQTSSLRLPGEFFNQIKKKALNLIKLGWCSIFLSSLELINYLNTNVKMIKVKYWRGKCSFYIIRLLRILTW